MERDDQECRMVADITFEQTEKPDLSVFFALPLAQQSLLRPSYDAFLFAACPAALFCGEHRVAIIGSICPEALANVQNMLSLFQLWYKHKQVPTIEYQSLATEDMVQPNQAACFMSGGVDSMANFSRNYLNYNATHPHRFHYAIFIYGMDLGDPNLAENKATFDRTVTSMAPFLKEHECELVPIATNIRSLEPNWRFYVDYQYGSLMASVAHALSNGISEFNIALDNQLKNYVARGSHPLLNKYFTSSYCQSVGVFEAYTRLDKYQFIKQLPSTVPLLRVCQQPPKDSDYLNCGVCAKCVRTKLELLVSGLLEQTQTFANKSLDAAQLEAVSLGSVLEFEFYESLEPALRQSGHIEFANILQRKLKKRWLLRFKYRFLQFDKLYLNNRILKTRLWLQPRLSF
ncbi:hypothetical protein D1Z90_12125 [Motilimonas pumila]|uniref:Uncharacterized protein n=2 Tax=Motilimonas pumila TaxID=2303987 RepID=A0A418YDI8_9GAMM|nr:hypothetical protein D1Z90_12125 [Motilimonas pumila]